MKYLKIKKNTAFQSIFKKGTRVFTPSLTIICVKSQAIAMGVAVSKKHGNAVKRNRIKRLIRAAFRETLPLLNKNFSIIIIPKVQEEYSFKEYTKHLEMGFKRMLNEKGAKKI